MPESVATDSREVAMIMAATELLRAMGVKTSPEELAEDYKVIYGAIMEAYHEVRKQVHRAAAYPQD